MTRLHRHLHAKKHRTLIVAKQAKPLLVDRLTFIAAVLEPLFTLPQVIAILRDHTAAGVSLTTWVGFDCLTMIWIWYGFTHKEKLILLYQGLFFIVQTTVIIAG